MRRRVVITGLGVIASNGIGKEEFWNALVNGRSGIRRITRFDTSTYSSQIAGEVDRFDPLDYVSSKNVKRMDRFAQFAVACAKMAFEDSGLETIEKDRDKIGVVFSSAVGGVNFAESQYSVFLEKGLRRVSPFLAISLFAGASSSQIAIEMGLKGYSNTISTACAAGSDAIGHAFHAIRNNLADIIISGGAEAPIVPLTFGAFCVINGLSSAKNEQPDKACRPFDRERDGFVMSEGGGAIVLEELEHALKRSAHIYGEVLGYGTTNDGYSMIQPMPDGEQTAIAIKNAFQDANIQPEEVNYINSHGTSTPLNDKLETAVIKKIFGDNAYRIPINSTKSMTGHSLGSSGAIELIASALTLENQFIHPTINYENPDPECDLDYVPNKGRKSEVDMILSNTLSFGGKNVALVLSKFSENSY
ncbi:MAG: beta-ketoacyl-ACP synthase II [Thermodesulfobacteriota bacterium]|nr:beta-ketoacyl-ACP synthase II [Thermodesulfobacteriota bacterium]